MWASYKKQKGFTIVELLIVIVVIGILAAITIVSFNGVQNKANDAAVRADLASMSKTLEMWKVENNGYPDAGVPTNNLQTVEFKVSKGSYAVSPTTVNNLVYCFDNTNRTRTYAIAALSKSGNAFYIAGSKPGVVQPFTNEWGESAGEDGAICVSLGDNMANSFRGYASNDTSVWRLWTGAN